MKTTTTEIEIKKIQKALAAIHIRLFGCESCDPKTNAQRNLCGRTHYVDEDTLRFHKSRIQGSGQHFGGLLFTVTCSDAIDPDNRRRGFRVAVFDVFGTCITRPSLAEASASSKAAHKVAEEFEIDLLQHYQEALKAMLKRKRTEWSEIEKGLSLLGVK